MTVVLILLRVLVWLWWDLAGVAVDHQVHAGVSYGAKANSLNCVPNCCGRADGGRKSWEESLVSQASIDFP